MCQVDEWIRTEGQVAFDLPVEYEEDGSLDRAICKRILSELLEPIFRAAGECSLFGTKVSAESFEHTGSEIQRALRKVPGRTVLPFQPGMMTRCAQFFSADFNEGRMMTDRRGTVTFVVPSRSAALKSLAEALAVVEIVKNYRRTMDSSALKYIRRVIEEDEQRAVVCLPGKFGMDVVYIFASPDELVSICVDCK